MKNVTGWQENLNVSQLKVKKELIIENNRLSSDENHIHIWVSFSQRKSILMVE